MKFQMKLNSNGDAFAQNPQEELADILLGISDRVRQYDYRPGHVNVIVDSNGNHCGTWKVFLR